MDGIVSTKWLSGSEMSSDLFTKNLARPLFEQHTNMYCGTDKYMKDYSTLKGRVSESAIESKPKYVSHKKLFVNANTGRTAGRNPDYYD
jgi:hypothetical protein